MGRNYLTCVSVEIGVVSSIEPRAVAMCCDCLPTMTACSVCSRVDWMVKMLNKNIAFGAFVPVPSKLVFINKKWD